MKKLMTMIASVATAFGLYAADPIEDAGFITGASFEPSPAYTHDNLSWTADDGFLPAYWSNLGGSHVTNLTYTYSKAASVGYPFAFNMENHDQYMAVSTTLGNPVEHKIAANPREIGNGIFFDSMVNMTIFDSSNDGEPTLPAGTKLAVYLQMADENESATNFVVCARDNASLEHRFVCSPDSAMTKIIPGWHRITIRAIGNILDSADETMSAFMVYVDGVAVSCTDAKITGATAANLAAVWASYNDMAQLFVSLDPEATELASVSFDGKGAVDDVVFTTTLPSFIQDPAKYTVKWDPTKVATLTIGGVLVSEAELAAGKAFRDYVDGVKTVAVVWTGKTGYCGGETTVDAVSGANTDISNLIEDAKVELTVGDVTTGYETLGAAVDAANLADENCTIKLLDNENAYEAALTFANANDAVITLDLNGCTIECTNESAVATIDVKNGTKLVITDTSDGAAGVIQGYIGEEMTGLSLQVAGEDELGAVAAEVTVDAGTFNGGVLGAITITSEIPKFNFADNGDEQGCWIDYTMGEDLDDYELAVDDKGDPQYWTVQEMKPEEAEVTFTAPENAKITKIVDGEGNEMPRVGDVFTLTVPGTYFATIEANDGYFYAEAPEAETVELARGATEYTLETPAPQKIVALINDTTPYASLAAAVAAAKSGDTVKLLGDAVGDCFAITASQCPGEGGLTIDLDDYTYTFNRSANDGITIQTNDVVTIKNGTFAVNAGAGAFRDFVRVYGNLDTAVTFTGVTFDTTNMDKTWTEVKNEQKIIRPTDAVRIEGGTVTFDGGSIGSDCEYAVKFGNHANKDQYALGTLTFDGDVAINGKVILMGGEFVEKAATGTIEYRYGANVHSTYEDGKATDGEGDALFAARVGEAMPESGDENNDAGVLCKTVDDAREALVEGKTLTFLADYELADDETFGGALAVIDGVQITLGKFKLTDKAGLLDVKTAFTDENVEVKDNEDGTFTYSVAAAPAEWPEEWADIPADDAVKAKFPAWRAGDGADADLKTDVAKNAFLLNCTTAEVSDIKIEEITVLADGFVGIKFSVPGMFGFKRPISEMNGALFVEAGDALDKMTAQNVATWSATDNTGNFSIKANFVRVKIGFKAPETDAVQPPPAE